jgi:putative membrane protein
MTARRITSMLGVLLLVGTACSVHAQSGTSQDAMFMRNAAADSLAEIQLGRIALDKSSSAQVKQLAQRIIDDHTKANDQLMAIAQRKQVSLPTEPMPMQKREADSLQAMSGAAFDQAYARTMVEDHRKAIKMFGMQSQNAADGDLRQFASTTLPVLKTHLQMAERLAGSGSMRERNSMDRAGGTPMDSNGSMGMPASGSSTH